jgi:hypothetical protein
MVDQLPNRAANAAIKGYLYQFDRTIIEVLKAPSGTTITVEGIEDIDIEHATDTEAVQCKYLEASKFSFAKIRAAIIPMLQSSRVDSRLRYRLYIYCGEGDAPSAMTLDELKQCLTSRSRSGEVTCHYTGISDKELESFAGRLTIVEGEEFETNRAIVHAMIQSELHCAAEDSTDLYYGNALAAINDLAIIADVSMRKVTKAELVKKINTKEALYTRWHKEIVGVQRYLSMLKRQAKACQALSPIMSRYLILEHSDAYQGDDYIAIIIALAKQHYGVGKLSTAKPWTVVVNCELNLLGSIKQGLLAAEIAYNDGYENVRFSPVLFDRWPVINTAGRASKIGVTSYDIRVVSDSTYRNAVAELMAPDRVVAITGVDLNEYKWPSMPQALQVANISVNQIKELLGV